MRCWLLERAEERNGSVELVDCLPNMCLSQVSQNRGSTLPALKGGLEKWLSKLKLSRAGIFSPARLRPCYQLVSRSDVLFRAKSVFQNSSLNPCDLLYIRRRGCFCAVPNRSSLLANWKYSAFAGRQRHNENAIGPNSSQTMLFNRARRRGYSVASKPKLRALSQDPHGADPGRYRERGWG